MNPASSASAAAWWTSTPRARPSRFVSSSSATRSNRFALTTRPRSDRAWRSTRPRSRRFRSFPAIRRNRIGPRPCSTTLDPPPDRVRVGTGRSSRERPQAVGAGPGQLRRSRREGSARGAAGRVAGRLGHGGRVARGSDGARDARAHRRQPRDGPHRLSAGGRVLGTRAGLGRGDPTRPRARRHDGPRRPHGRAAPSGRSSSSPTTRSSRRRWNAPRTRTRRPSSSASDISAAASGCRKRSSSSGPRPTSSRKSGRSTSAASRRRARSCRTSATSRPAISSSTSTTASDTSSDSSGSTSGSSRRSSWSFATRAKTSCSCPSNGSISFRNTPARPGQRSIAWAARPGRRPRRASRKPCATWPRSCSSSTPRARRCRVTPSAPTPTGSRSSRTPSSGN